MYYKRFYNKLILLFLFLSSSYVNNRFFKYSNPSISLQNHSLNFNDSLTFFNFGQKRMISSLLWVKTLLDSDLEHYKRKDLNNWMYLRFDTVANLDPYFLENYQFGGVFLSIIKDDLLGAEMIYNKGLSQYPNDYYLNINAAFHYFHEMHNIDKAIPLLLKARTFPQAPPIIDLLIATLYKKNKAPKAILKKFLEEALLQNSIDQVKKELQKKVKDIDAE